jgi:cobalt-precorrin-5B (C1)-methyltransferase
MTTDPPPSLRRGWTTGACATAAATAAAIALVTGRFPDPVTVRLLQGRSPTFALAHQRLGPVADRHPEPAMDQNGDWAEAGVIKDAGDDPDVTHGALVVARVCRLAPGRGLVFRAGEGVGTVTLPGLPLAVGEPAINPGPRAMMAANLAGLLPDAEICLSIRDGAALAAQTLNPRLGIVGGLSILGTSGVVVPYSCSAWVQAIHRAVDVARAAGADHLGAVTGSTSEQGLRVLYPALPEVAIIDVGDFMGGLLKYLRHHPVARVTIAGGFAKLSKLAAGALNLHSKASAVDPGWLAGVVGEIGGDPGLVTAAANASTAMAVLDLATRHRLPLADAIAARAQAVAWHAVDRRVAIEVAVFDRSGGLAGRSPDTIFDDTITQNAKGPLS